MELNLLKQHFFCGVLACEKVQRCINLAISDCGKKSSNCHFIYEDLSMVTLTYLLVGKALNMFLVCKSKFKSSELDCQ